MTKKMPNLKKKRIFNMSIPCYMQDSCCFVFIDYALFEFILFLTCQQFKMTSVKCLECIYFCKVGGIKYQDSAPESRASPLDCFL